MFLFSQLYSSVSVTSLACYPRSADWWLLFSLSLSRDKVVTSLIGGLFLLLHIYLSPFPNSFSFRYISWDEIKYSTDLMKNNSLFYLSLGRLNFITLKIMFRISQMPPKHSIRFLVSWCEIVSSPISSHFLIIE